MIGPLLFLTALVLLFASPLILHRLRQRKRTEDMRRAAEELGLAFSPVGDPDALKELSGFHLFTQGNSRQIFNVMRGVSDGLEVQIFDYSYTTGGEESLKNATHTVVRFRSPELKLPSFSVRPKSVVHRIASLFGYQDIIVDGHPNFSKNYLLRGRDETAIRALFNEQVLAYYGRGSSLFTEGSGTEFVFYRWAQPVEPEHVRFFLQEGFEVLSLFWQTSSRLCQELSDDFRQRFGVRIAGDVTAAPDRHPAGIRKTLK
jgi:hypothetical protein